MSEQTNEDREAEAMAWAAYRSDVSPNSRTLAREAVAFKAGWDAALSRAVAPERGEWIYGAQRAGEKSARRFGSRERADRLKDPHERVVRAWQVHASTGPWEPLPEGETDE